MDRITELRARRAAGLEAMEAIVAAASAEGRDLTADEAAKYDGHKADDDKLTAELARLEDLERRKAAAARPVQPLPGVTPPAATVPAQARNEADRGVRFGRAFRALAAAGGNVVVAAQIAESWGDTDLFANQNVTTGAAGGFLVREEVSAEVIELLRPASVVMSLNPVVIDLPTGNLTMNRQATGANASYVGEQANQNATGMTLGQVKLSAKKLLALVPISNDLLRQAGVAADRLVRDDLITSLAVSMDRSFIRGAGTEFSPRGLRFQNLGTAFATSHILTQTGSTLANVTTDLGRLELALENADIPMLRPGWLMAPRTAKFLMGLRDGNGNFAFPEMNNGLLRGKPYRTTTQIPTNLGGGSNESELLLADFAQVVVGEHMGIDIAVSTEAAYLDSAGTMRAAFTRDETLMRAIAQHDLGMRHLQAIAVLTGVTWTP